MDILSTFVQYLRLKLFISFFRLLVKLAAPFPQPQPDSTLKIPSRDNGRTITAHIYKPPAPAEAESNGNSGPSPVLINFYGSAFAVPLYGRDDGFCRHVARATGYVVLDVDYRLAPEHPFPAALNDMEDAIKYVLDHHPESGQGQGDDAEHNKTLQLSLSGFSSGGTLALIAPTLFSPGTFQSLVAFYPATDIATDPGLRKPPSPTAKPRSPFWTRICRQAYLRGGLDPRDPRISPAYATDTASYPANMLVVTADQDASALEAELLATKAEAEGAATGRKVILRRMQGVGHDFDKRNKDSASVEAKDEAYALVVDLLKKGATAMPPR